MQYKLEAKDATYHIGETAIKISEVEKVIYFCFKISSLQNESLLYRYVIGYNVTLYYKKWYLHIIIKNFIINIRCNNIGILSVFETYFIFSVSNYCIYIL